MQVPHRFRLLLAAVFCVATAIGVLLFLRAYELDRFNVGWGDTVADRKHKLLWYGTLTCSGAFVLAAIWLAKISHRAAYAIGISAAVTLFVSVLSRFGTHTIQTPLFVPQLPGYVAAIYAFGVHDSSTAFSVWVSAVNTLCYAPVVYAMLRSPKSERDEYRDEPISK